MGIEKFFAPVKTTKGSAQEKKPTKDSDEKKPETLSSKAETSTKPAAAETTRKRKHEEKDDDDDMKPTKSTTSTSNRKKTKATAALAAPKKKKKKDDDDAYFEPIEGFEDEEEEAPAIAKTARDTKKGSSSESKEKDKEEKAGGDSTGEKKKKNFYQAMNREGPRAIGTRPLPVGEENCLAGYTFVLSGELETMTKETASDLIKRYGGRITGAVSGKTTFLVRGRDAGETKTAKAKQLGTKILDEDGFYDLFKTEKAKSYDEPAPTKSKGKGKSAKSKASAAEEELPPPEKADDPDSTYNLWTEKYKPRTTKDIVGNKELVRKISVWMENWQSSMEKGFPITKDDDGISSYRALLLSGPPGIGKTTTAHVVARTYGYEPLEFNASDVRSKKVLEENVTEMLDNRTMTEYFQGDRGEAAKMESSSTQGKKVVLIMDEVDGMSSGDRGGSAELASLIRKTKIPVICICNDVRSQKVQPLLRVCYDARFKRTPAQQLRSRLLTIAYREKLNIQPNAIDELVQATRNDLRQIINILSTYRISKSSLNYDEAKLLGKSNEKYTQMNIFEIPIALLSGGSWRSKTLNDKYEIYFHDYSLSHLMMFDSYIKADPEKAARTARSHKQSDIECNKLKLMAEAAEAIADGDLVDTKIHGSAQQYSLMPVHSIFSCVRPAYYMEGSLAGFKPFFPSWLGQYSKGMKHTRLLNDIRNRLRLHSSANRYEVRANYVPTLSDRIFGCIKKEEYDDAMQIIDNYYLDRENLEALSDLHLGSKKPMSQLSAKEKTTFTKMYNSQNHPTLFHTAGTPIKKVAAAAPAEDIENEFFEEDADYGLDVSEEEEEEEEDIKDDTLIKQAEKRKHDHYENDSVKAESSSSRPKQKRKPRK